MDADWHHRFNLGLRQAMTASVTPKVLDPIDLFPTRRYPDRLHAVYRWDRDCDGAPQLQHFDSHPGCERVLCNYSAVAVLRCTAERVDPDDAGFDTAGLFGLALLDGVAHRAHRPTRASAVFTDGVRHRCRSPVGHLGPVSRIDPPGASTWNRRTRALRDLLETLTGGVR